jgi:hypothetical protein
MLREYLGNRPDLGLWKAVASGVMEPSNPFETKSVRRPRRWFVLFVIVSLTSTWTFVYFNFWN